VGLVTLRAEGSILGTYEANVLRAGAQLVDASGGGPGFPQDHQDSADMMQLAQSIGPVSNYDGNSGSVVLATDLIPRNMSIKSINTQRFEPMLREKIEKLNLQKSQAVEAEDFDQAKYYKSVVDKLMVMGNQLLQLQAEKTLAIDNEDYDMAKHIKVKMEELRDIIYQVNAAQARPADDYSDDMRTAGPGALEAQSYEDQYYQDQYQD